MRKGSTGSTLTEVAKAAGVSMITASRAIRGLGYVSEATRQRVLQAAEQLHYQPDMLAKRMRGDTGNLIGVFINNFGSVVMHELISAISQEARRLGYDLVVFHAQSFNEPGRAATSDMLRKLCEGLLLVLPNTFDHYLDRLEKDRFPCVLVNFAARKMELPVVVCQNRQGARDAIDHLLRLGHRRIGFIAGTPFTGQSAERQRGYVDALCAAGVDIDPALIVEGDFTQVSGFPAAEHLLSLADPPTAIFAANDEMALGALDAIRTRGLSVPDDISLVGFDDIPAARYAYPALTTLSQPFADMGVRAVKELVEIMKGKEVAAQRIEFATPMALRGSTGPVRDAAAAAPKPRAARNIRQTTTAQTPTPRRRTTQSGT